VEYHVAKRNNRPQEKVYIPKDEFPEINFFGLLVGPRGNSLKKMESESGAKISIRGKGSVKEGKGRPDAFSADEEDELHCLVMADTQEKVDTCVRLINKVIETVSREGSGNSIWAGNKVPSKDSLTRFIRSDLPWQAASVPEGQNDHKRNQLRELASLNGTLRDDENQLCQNCGEKGHRKFECPQARTFHANVICRACGGAGHMARDCMNRGNPNAPPAPVKEFDSEYQSLMAELGEGGAVGATGGPVGAITSGPGGDRPPWGQDKAAGGAVGGATGPDGKKIPPWRVPENWFSNREFAGMLYLQWSKKQPLTSPFRCAFRTTSRTSRWWWLWWIPTRRISARWLSTTSIRGSHRSATDTRVRCMGSSTAAVRGGVCRSGRCRCGGSLCRVSKPSPNDRVGRSNVS
jgi:splicing factor 1